MQTFPIAVFPGENGISVSTLSKINKIVYMTRLSKKKLKKVFVLNHY